MALLPVDSSGQPTGEERGEADNEVRRLLMPPGGPGTEEDLEDDGEDTVRWIGCKGARGGCGAAGLLGLDAILRNLLPGRAAAAGSLVRRTSGPAAGRRLVLP